MQLISNSEEETKNIAKKIASQLKVKDIIILEGDLGAGKTKFTEGILEYFNLQDEISSPTFTIVNEYNTSKFNIYHFDVYRLADIDEFYAMGGEEYFEKGICIIEWGEIIEECLPRNYIKINITRDLGNENIRKFDIKIFGDLKIDL